MGIQLYGHDLKGIRFKDIIFRNNRVQRRGYTDAVGKKKFPIGIQIQILRANYQNLLFEDNCMDVPDFGSGTYIPQEPYSMSIVCFSRARWEQDAESGNVKFVNNRNSKGRLLCAIVAVHPLSSTVILSVMKNLLRCPDERFFTPRCSVQNDIRGGGELLRPILADWWFKNKPVWGKSRSTP